MIIYCIIFNKRTIYRNLYLFIFYTKMTIFPHKVRHVSARRDVCLCLTANYLHIDILDQNIKKIKIFCVSLLCVLSSCEVSPLFGDHRLQRAGRESRRFRAPCQMLHQKETEQQTRGLNQDCYMSAKSASVQANAICPKIIFFYWYRNLLFFK